MVFSNSYLVTCQYYLRVVRREKCCTCKPQPDFVTLIMLFCVSENADLGIIIIKVTIFLSPWAKKYEELNGMKVVVTNGIFTGFYNLQNTLTSLVKVDTP